MIDVLEGYADAAFESARANGHLEETRGALEAFGRALVAHEQLHNVLSDPTVSSAAKQAVIVDLLRDRSEEASSTAAFAARVVRSGELPQSMSQLLELAEAISTGGEHSRITEAGRLGSRDRVRGYAERVLQELSSPAEIDEVEDELFRLARILDDNRELRRALSDPSTSVRGRVGILVELLSNKVSAPTLRLASYVIEVGKLRDLTGTYEWLVELCAQERGRRVGEVHSAVELDAAEVSRLSAALSRLVGRPVEIRNVIDANTVGGMLVSVGDLVIDGTIRSRFERLRDVFAH
jgi:ATP synthase F1 delta subunit